MAAIGCHDGIAAMGRSYPPVHLQAVASQAVSAQCKDGVRFPYRCGAAPALDLRPHRLPVLSRSRDRHRQTQHNVVNEFSQHDMCCYSSR